MATIGSNVITSPSGASAPAGHSIQSWVKGFVLLVAFAGLFYVFFDRQARHSAAALEDWGHAFVVPFISAWAIWQNRAELRQRRAAAFWPGLLPLILGIVCYFFFIVGFPNHMFMGLSMILTLAGLCLLLLGPSIFQVIFLPIAYLVFAVSVSEQVIIKITFILQQIAAQGAWLILRIISALGPDFVVFIDGNTLTVSGKALNVAEACSGMRMVVAFMALAGAVGLLTTKVWWQRVALMLLAVPVAVFNNMLRVAVLGLLSMWKSDLAAGDAHMLIGTVLLVLGLGMFMGIQWLLARIVREPQPAAKAQVTRA